MRQKLTRRTFIMGTGMGALAVATGCQTPARMTKAKPRTVALSEKLNIAAIGCGGKGMSDIAGCRHENVVALCDIDERQAAQARREFPDAVYYRDFREMLEKHPEIDACTISTPDHNHAYAAMVCMQLGKHVYVQKPLTHDLYESRMLQEAAHEYGVATQMGNQGQCGEGVLRTKEVLGAGVIGTVREVHCWTNRPIWAQGHARPNVTHDVPDAVSWDLWLGTAPERPFVSIHPETGKPCYHPFHWRGWWEFGTGALGDMACHIMNPANAALDLDVPKRVEVVSMEGATEETGPVRSIVKYEFSAKGKRPALTMYWYEGGLKPEHPEGVPEDEQLGGGDNGTLFIGDEGVVTCDTHGDNPRLMPAARMADFDMPDPYLERVPDEDPYKNWLNAAKGGDAPKSNFDYACPLNEIVLLGCLAQRANVPIEWDSKRLEVTNSEGKIAQQYVQREYRQGWTLA